MACAESWESNFNAKRQAEVWLVPVGAGRGWKCRQRSEGSGPREAWKEGGFKSMRKGKSPQVERWIMKPRINWTFQDKDPL